MAGSSRPCFNVATALKPWKTWALLAEGARFTELQCGHGVEAVEDAGGGGGAAAYSWLQCGHGVEAVEDDSPDVLHVEGAKLQCGHGVEAVEDSIGSRRPRGWSRTRFNVATALKPWKTAVVGGARVEPDHASMWPRR